MSAVNAGREPWERLEEIADRAGQDEPLTDEELRILAETIEIEERLREQRRRIERAQRKLRQSRQKAPCARCGRKRSQKFDEKHCWDCKDAVTLTAMLERAGVAEAARVADALLADDAWMSITY